MKTLVIELRIEKRTGVIPVLLAVGILGAAYAFVNFICLLYTSAYEAAALRKIRAAVSFCFSDDAHAIRRAVFRRIPPCQFSSFIVPMSYTN